ncbi:MAG TPA: hypothetical protein VHU24_07455 [Solirubrobacterales bacterium]|nr:hypothetical protein [Solirubrobacterales bacterium]
MEVKDDVKLRTRKLAVFVTCLGIAAAFPVLSSADKGGVPNAHSKPCHVKKHHHKKPKPNNKGKKCGFNEGTTTTTTTTPSTTSTETETTTTTTSTSS